MRRMLCTLVLIVHSCAAFAQVQMPVRVQATLDPASGAVVGQRIALYVDVLFPDSMPHPPRVEIPDMPGAQIFRFETQATTRRDTIGGQPYVGQRFEFAIYPRRAGELVVPPAKVTLLARDGSVTGAAQGEAVKAEIVAPTGVDASRAVVATQSLTLDEQWAPEPGTSFKPGDALVRTITRSAQDVPGLAMLDLAFTAPEGVRVYAAAPEADDRIDRGAVTGHRIDRVTYVFEKAGTFALPAVSQPWWDLGGSALATAQAAGITVTVTAPTASPPDAGLLATLRRQPGRAVAIVLLGLMALAALGYGGSRAVGALRARRSRWEDSEEKAFRDLIATCHGDDPAPIYRAYANWHGRLASAARPPVDDLERALFGGGAWSDPRSRALAVALRAYRASTHAKVPPHASALPPLNPAASGL